MGKLPARKVQYNELVYKAISRAVAMAPFLLVFILIFIYLGVLGTTRYYSIVSIYILVAAIISLSIFHFIQKKPNVYRYLGFVAAVLFFAIYIAGIETLFFMWIILATIGALNYGRKMVLFLIILLYVVYGIDTLYEYFVLDKNVLAHNFVFVSLTTLSTYAVTNVIFALKTDYTNVVKMRRREEFRYAQIQALLNSVDDAIISVDTKGNIKIYNASALSLFDTNKDIKNMYINDLLNAHTASQKKVDIFSYVKKQHRTIMTEQFFHTYSSGDSMRFHLTVSVIRSNFEENREALEGYIMIMRDITKAKSLEEERDEFISVISHELRTPVTIIEGMLSNLELSAEQNQLDFNYRQKINQAHQQTVYISGMINDLASLSRADNSTPITHEPIGIYNEMVALYKEYNKQARQKGLLFNLDVSQDIGTIETNRLYLIEILQNFITNAIKYTPKGTVSLGVIREKDHVRFVVSDTGIGIAKTEQDDIFKKFYRAEDYRTKETKGTGLGLYVAQKLAHKLGAHISLKSRLHHGSVFSLNVPVSQENS